jgi:hypothetical protein
MRLWKICLLLSALAWTSCATDVVVLPSDRELRPAYTDTGRSLPQHVTISRGYLRELILELDACTTNIRNGP